MEDVAELPVDDMEISLIVHVDRGPLPSLRLMLDRILVSLSVSDFSLQIKNLINAEDVEYRQLFFPPSQFMPSGFWLCPRQQLGFYQLFLQKKINYWDENPKPILPAELWFKKLAPTSMILIRKQVDRPVHKVSQVKQRIKSLTPNCMLLAGHTRSHYPSPFAQLPPEILKEIATLMWETEGSFPPTVLSIT